MPTAAQLANTKRQRQEQVATCVRCREEKSWVAFEASPSRRPFGLASNCKPCDAERKRLQHIQARKNNPNKAKVSDRDKNLRRKFGISVAEYDLMLEKQNGCCAICYRSERYIHHYTRAPARLAVDHDHETGKVRALLCANCNKALGGFEDNPVLLQNAISYLKEHQR